MNVRAERAADGTVSITGLTMEQAWSMYGLAFQTMADASDSAERDADEKLIEAIGSALTTLEKEEAA